MGASKSLITLLTVALTVALTATACMKNKGHKNNPYEFSVCSEDTKNCMEKFRKCFAATKPQTDHEKDDYWNELRNSYLECSKAKNDNKQQPNSKMSPLVVCTLHKRGKAIDGKINKLKIKEELRSFSSDSSIPLEAQKALIEAAEECPQSSVQDYYDYHRCIVINCAAAS